VTSFAIQLQFKLAPANFIATDAHSVTLTIPNLDRTVKIITIPPQPIKDTQVLYAVVSDFPSPDDAFSFGRKIRDTLIICGSLSSLGIEISKHEEIINSAQIQLQSNQLSVQPIESGGLVVYPQEATIDYSNVQISIQGGPPVEMLQRVFSVAFSLSNNLNTKLGLAFELYNSHRFENSTRAQFLQLISVIECLAEPRKQTDVIVGYINTLVIQTKQQYNLNLNINNDELEVLIQRLNELKRESISSACRNLVSQVLGDSPAKTFRACYSIRSKMVHEGILPVGINLEENYIQLSILVRELLYKLISKEG